MHQWTDARDHLRLIRAEGVGAVTYRRLRERYRSAAAALEALPRLARAGGRAEAPHVPAAAEAEREMERTRAAGGRLVFLGDAPYPAPLAMLDDAPPCLIMRGEAALAGRRCVAMVGARNASANGQRMAEQLAAELARDVVVVSGLARGIDTAAHRGAMRVGRTVGVIAGGLDRPYPPENTDLQRRIGEGHLLVTEAPLGMEPQARHFPRRNRIIAGLSLGVLVVEAALRSGSLITARMARDAGREVFAVPGSPLDPRARGGNDLIRQGAVLAETAADVLDALPPAPAGPVPRGVAEPEPSWPAEPEPSWPMDEEVAPHPRSATDAVLRLLSQEPTAVDDLVRRCQLSPPVAMAVLLELELAARVETLPGSRVALLPGPVC